ncbi:MAG: aminotransferase class III-fold pyridoxal phosphate-dependent enzyme, partial [Sedimentisphaerales bacterium]|nr:aminotransferase class III-fold pyridoxal phosphate-dependent enzyme [Sedimentisphaerales bacterium]
KIIGGGLPIGAVGGRADIMDMLAPLGPVYQAGTLSGNPIATAAANATLDILKLKTQNSKLKTNPYKYLELRSALLEVGFVDAAKQAGVLLTMNRVGSIMSCFFTDRKVRNFADVQSTNMKKFKRFFAEMLKRGIYLAPSAYEAMFVSLAHTKKDIEKTIEAARKSFHKIK